MDISGAAAHLLSSTGTLTPTPKGSSRIPSLPPEKLLLAQIEPVPCSEKQDRPLFIAVNLTTNLKLLDFEEIKTG